MACEPFVPRAGDEGDESIASFVRRRFGEEAVDYLAEPLLAGIHAGDVDRLSMRALFPRLVDAERQSGSVIRAFRALRATPSPQGAFVSLPGGTGELIDALSRALAPGTIMLSARVTDLRRAGDYAVESPAGVVHARSVILSRAGLRGGEPAARVRHDAGGPVRRRPVRVDRHRGVRLPAAIRFAIRCAAAASSCRASSTARCSRPPGSRRSGRAAHPTVTCCCARFSAAGATRTGSSDRTRS